MSKENKKVLTPKFRVSFPAVFKPKAFEGQEPKYSVVMLFDKKTDLKALKDAVTAAATEKWGAKDKWPKGLRMPFRDGDERSDMQGYAGHYFVTATSKQKPGVVNGQLDDIISEDEFYAGCYARATLLAFAYDKAGNKGVSLSLQNIQKIADGETFSGRKRAADEFQKLDDDSENAANYSSNVDDLMG